jgi:hypothetical protein
MSPGCGAGSSDSSICARDTWLAGSVLDRERTVNLSISSSVIVNSTARRHPAMIPLLVWPSQNKESAIQSSVPQRRFHGIDRLVYLQARVRTPRAAIVRHAGSCISSKCRAGGRSTFAFSLVQRLRWLKQCLVRTYSYALRIHKMCATRR